MLARRLKQISLSARQSLKLERRFLDYTKVFAHVGLLFFVYQAVDVQKASNRINFSNNRDEFAMWYREEVRKELSELREKNLCRVKNMAILPGAEIIAADKNGVKFKYADEPILKSDHNTVASKTSTNPEIKRKN